MQLKNRFSLSSQLGTRQFYKPELANFISHPHPRKHFYLSKDDVLICYEKALAKQSCFTNQNVLSRKLNANGITENRTFYIQGLTIQQIQLLIQRKIVIKHAHLRLALLKGYWAWLSCNKKALLQFQMSLICPPRGRKTLNITTDTYFSCPPSPLILSYRHF